VRYGTVGLDYFSFCLGGVNSGHKRELRDLEIILGCNFSPVHGILFYGFAADILCNFGNKCLLCPLVGISRIRNLQKINTGLTSNQPGL